MPSDIPSSLCSFHDWFMLRTYLRFVCVSLRRQPKEGRNQRSHREGIELTVRLYCMYTHMQAPIHSVLPNHENDRFSSAKISPRKGFSANNLGYLFQRAPAYSSSARPHVTTPRFNLRGAVWGGTERRVIPPPSAPRNLVEGVLLPHALEKMLQGGGGGGYTT